MKEMTEEQKVELRIQALRRLLELYTENEKLKKELKSRRRQADVWRKKCHAMSKRKERI